MTKKRMKEIFKARGVKTNEGPLKMLEAHLARHIDVMAQRCDFRNIKVLRMDNFEFALPNPFKKQ